MFGLIQNKIYQNGSYYKSQWINSINQMSYDIAFIGNSRGALHHFDDPEIKYINLSEDGSGLKTTYCQLHLFFKNNNQSKIIAYDVDLYSLRKINDKKRSPRWIPYFNDPVIYETLKNEHPTFKFHKLLPAINYATFKYDWNQAALINNLFNLRDSPWGSNGYMCSDTSYIDAVVGGRSDFDELPPNWYWIDKIHELCKANNAELKLITSPYFKMLDDIQSNPVFERALSKRGISYDDYSRLLLGRKEYFRDNRHLNLNGTKKYISIIKNKLINQQLEN